MPRQISPEALKAMLAQSTSEVFIELLTISHVSMLTPLRLCNNGAALISNGQTYEPASFLAELPADAEDQEPRAVLQVSGVDQSIVRAVRGLSGRPHFEIAIVTSSQPNSYVYQPHAFDVLAVRGNAETLVFEMIFSELTQEAFPSLTFSPVHFRALHRRTA